jgi:hypothetical protein
MNRPFPVLETRTDGPAPIPIEVEVACESHPTREIAKFVGWLRQLFRGSELRLHSGPLRRIILVIREANVRPEVWLYVPDRDDPARGREVVIRADRGISLEDLGRMSWQEMRRELARCVLETCTVAVTHELEEGLWIDGQRMFDPHEGEGGS